MSDSESESRLRPKPRMRQEFTATSWTAVAAASDPNTPEARAALEELCRVYWYPLYAYARRRGYGPDQAEDLTQEFFFRLLRDNYLKSADRERGKFRSFLLSSMMHFLSNERARANAAKRGGKHTIVSMEEEQAEDRYLKDTISDPSAVKVFEHGWASTLLDQARQQLREEYKEAGKETLFGHLEHFLREESATGDYPALAKELNMKAGAVAVMVHRLRQRFAELCREAVAQTLQDPNAAAVEEELSHLLQAVGGK